LASGWVLAYGGVFFLGFGGSRWTSDMAINYYKTVLGMAAQLMAMVLLVGIGKTFLDDYYTRMSAGISLKEMGVMLIVVIILLALTNKIPAAARRHHHWRERGRCRHWPVSVPVLQWVPLVWPWQRPRLAAQPWPPARHRPPVVRKP
jgi:Na+/melibiose symporter-like transporter